MSTYTETSIEQRIQAAVCRALRISDPPAALRMGSTPGWDSMGHMTVVLELEREFNTRFPPYQLPHLVDVASIVNTLTKANLVI